MIERLRARILALKATIFDRSRELERAEMMVAQGRAQLGAAVGGLAELEALLREEERRSSAAGVETEARAAGAVAAAAKAAPETGDAAVQ